MPFEQYVWQGRIKGAEREYKAMRIAAMRLSNDVRNNPTLLDRELEPNDLSRAVASLEGTYVIRVFAEFETALRSYWHVRKPRKSPQRMHDLMQSIASTCRIANEQLQNAHAVREYRNGLVHERDESPDAIPLPTARGHLCHFLRYLI